MRVTVRLFARLRDIAGASELARELAPGATIGDVWRQLAREFPELASYERSISSAVNADYARMDQVVGRRRRGRVPASRLRGMMERRARRDRRAEFLYRGFLCVLCGLCVRCALCSTSWRRKNNATKT